jgi:hypothetical protein
MSVVDETKVIETTRTHTSIDRVYLLDLGVEHLVFLEMLCGQSVLNVQLSATSTFEHISLGPEPDLPACLPIQ